jgi:elongation factor G
VREALEHGILVGHPMVDIKVTLFDGSHHEADSNEIAFKDAPEKLCQYSSSQE